MVVRGAFDLFGVELADDMAEEPVYRKSKSSNDGKSAVKDEKEQDKAPEKGNRPKREPVAPLMSFKTKTTTIVTFKGLTHYHGYLFYVLYNTCLLIFK